MTGLTYFDLGLLEDPFASAAPLYSTDSLELTSEHFFEFLELWPPIVCIWFAFLKKTEKRGEREKIEVCKNLMVMI